MARGPAPAAGHAPATTARAALGLQVGSAPVAALRGPGAAPARAMPWVVCAALRARTVAPCALPAAHPRRWAAAGHGAGHGVADGAKAREAMRRQ